MASLREVGTFMAGLGLVVDHPTKLVFRGHSELKDRGLLPSPDSLGSTRWSYNQPGRVVGDLVIGIVAGLPAAQCRAVIAHEFGHALLAGSSGARSLPPKVVEGFCETLAGGHLSDRQSHRGEKIALHRIQNNPDSTYGDGYRLLAPAVERFGARSALDALRDGAPERIGVRT